MVKGISRQVIVLHSPDPKLFDQAIFILKEEAVGQAGVTDELLLKEAKRLIQNPTMYHTDLKHTIAGPLWACGGALLTGIAWVITALFL